MTTTSHRTARLIIPALILALCSMFLQATPATAKVSRNAEEAFLSKVNKARENRGLRPLRMKRDLRLLARDQSKAMAVTDTLFHSPSLDSTIDDARRWGENVGYGYSVRSIHKMLMKSPGHRANILNRKFREVGIGVERLPNGKIWVTQIFRQPL